MNSSTVNFRSVYSGYDIKGNYPAPGTITKVTAAPQPVKLDLSSFLVGTIAGGFIALLFIYGVAPAAFQYGAAKIRERTPR